MGQMYEMIYKRKSVRHYDGSQAVSAQELEQIRCALDAVEPLLDIPVSFRIVRREETTCMWGEYCLMAYSEPREGYLLNIGYLLEQMDLVFASMEIGACWYGFGKPKETDAVDGKEFVIMMAFGKCKMEKFRQESAKIRRKKLDVICGDMERADLLEVLRTAHYAPSACNSQPWRVRLEAEKLQVYRSRNIVSRFAAGLIGYMNLIDMGIFLYFLELALKHEGICFQRTLLREDLEKEPVPVAIYRLENTAL